MIRITQDMEFCLSLIKYANKYGVAKAAIKYKIDQQYIYCWKRCFDGLMESLRDLSRSPHHHPDQYTPQEITVQAKPVFLLDRSILS